MPADRIDRDPDSENVEETSPETLAQAKFLNPDRFLQTHGNPGRMSREERQRAIVRFCELLHEGKSQTEAAFKAGFGKNRRTAGVIGTRLARDPVVHQTLAQIRHRAGTVEEPQPVPPVSRDWIVARLQYESLWAEQATARIRALELLGKVEGIYAPEQTTVAIGTLFADVLEDDPIPALTDQTDSRPDGDTDSGPAEEQTAPDGSPEEGSRALSVAQGAGVASAAPAGVPSHLQGGDPNPPDKISKKNKPTTLRSGQSIISETRMILA